MKGWEAGVVAQTYGSQVERRAFGKAVTHLIPLMMVLYLVSFLDRVNVGFAALTMNADLNFTPEIYGWGAGIFFLGYFLFEVPSNLALEKVGARIWICRIMVTWGLISAATAFVTLPGHFYLLRFLLGAAEAGFLPGMILYLGYWFPLATRARYIALFMAAVPIASAVGSPVSALILDMTHGAFGLAGWQWLFIMEGLPACLLGFVVLAMLPDGPQKANWLTKEEKQAIAARLAADVVDERIARHALWPALTDARVLLLGLVYLGIVVGLYGVGLWLPQIMQSMGYATREIGLILIVPYALSAVAMLAFGRHSDRKGERILHVAAGAFLGAAGVLASVYAGNHLLAITAISLASMGIYGALGPFWAVPPLFLRGTAAAAGIALINSIGNLGGFFGPYLVGWMRQATGRFEAGFEVLALILALAGVLVVVLGRRLHRA